MTDAEIDDTIVEYESKYQLPTTDVLKFGCNKLVNVLITLFPEVQRRLSLI
jgi:hypothetical protein